VALLDRDDDLTLVTVDAADGTSVHCLDFHTMEPLDKQCNGLEPKVLACGFSESQLVTLENDEGCEAEVRVYSCAPRFRWCSTWSLPGIAFGLAQPPLVAVSSCCGYVAVVGQCISNGAVFLVLFSLAKGTATSKVRVRASDVVGLAFRGSEFRSAEQVVTVTSAGKVTYYTLQLDVAFEFEFGLQGVSSVSVRDELWAVVSGDELFLCQDKFYVQ
jgi:hypothetical protein